MIPINDIPVASLCNQCGTRSRIGKQFLDQVEVAKEGLEKAQTEQWSGVSRYSFPGIPFLTLRAILAFADPIHARMLTLNLVDLLKPRMALTSQPLLPLLRLHQSLLIDAVAANSNLLDTAIRTNAEVVAALTDLLPYGHPVRAVSIAELGRLLCVDEPATIDRKQGDTFPPSGIHRLKLAKDTLERAMAELSIGFGEGGGDVSRRVRVDLNNIRKEIELFDGLVDRSRRRMQ